MAVIRYFLLSLLGLGVLWADAPSPGIPAREGGIVSPHSCLAHIRRAEEKYNIPHHLLLAIAKIESGRKDKKGNINPWPWTINVEGKGYTYESKLEAIAAVQKFQGQGKASIDVGCMQVNMLHHPGAFPTLHLAFEPHKNVEYAAKFLKGLYDTHGTWEKAVAHYHSATPKYHIPYRQKVLALWGKEKTGTLLALDEGAPRSAVSGRLERLKALASRRGRGGVRLASRSLSANPRSDRGSLYARRNRGGSPVPEEPVVMQASSVETVTLPEAAAPVAAPQGRIVKRTRTIHHPKIPRPGEVKSRTASKKSSKKS